MDRRMPSSIISDWFGATLRGGRFRRRYDVINHFARRRGLRRYLEIGTREGRCLREVLCPDKTGVDPAPRIVKPEWKIQEMTSDAFFKTNTRRFELVFIDGLHLAEQVVRDIYNALAVLDAPGVILMHDCNPQEEHHQYREEERSKGRWNGDVWKALAFVRSSDPSLIAHVVDVDEGIGVVIPREYGKTRALTPELEREAETFFKQTDWPHLVAQRQRVLGLIENSAAALEREITAAGLTRP